MSDAMMRKLLQLQQVDGQLAHLYGEQASNQHAIITCEERRKRLQLEIHRLKESER